MQKYKLFLKCATEEAIIFLPTSFFNFLFSGNGERMTAFSPISSDFPVCQKEELARILGRAKRRSRAARITRFFSFQKEIYGN